MKVAVIFGTRPEGIKMAPLVKQLKEDADMDCVFINTAQHREMLDQVLELFSIQPDYDLNIMKKGQTVEGITSDIILNLSSILESEMPDLVLVHGDTTTTFAASYASFLKKIPVGHVEAGLRTYQHYSPFPEELNRQLVSRLATYHFAVTERNKENLLQENIREDHITVVGNTVIDALLDVSTRKYQYPEPIRSIVQDDKKIILLTTHRRENIEQLSEVFDAINLILLNNRNTQVVFPVHKNPVIREKVDAAFTCNERVHLIEPLDYESFVHVMKASYLIITDSGGIQEEAPALGKPVLVARDTTERPEGVEAGTLKLVGTVTNRIVEECDRLINSTDEYEKMKKITNPYGDGHTSEKIIDYIKARFHIPVKVESL